MQLADGTMIGYVILPRRRFFAWTLWTTTFLPTQGTVASGSWNFLFRRSARAKLGRIAGELIDAAEAARTAPPPPRPVGLDLDA